MRIQDKGSTQRAITKDGYLVVPATISKLGVFDYLASEIGQNGHAIKKVARTENSLFSDSTMKSFDGMPITIGHPENGVNAKNWKELAVGTVRNVQRVNDTLTAEAWIYDENAIKLVQDGGISELSCGYDCDLKASTQDGVDFEMSPMIGNHIAIVASGRCGSSVKLADKETVMSKSVKLLDSLLAVFGIKLTDEQKQAVEKGDENAKSSDERDEKADKSSKPNQSDETEDKGKKEQPNEPEKEKKEMADEALKKQLADAQAEIQRLKDEAAKTETANKTALVLNDAKAVFANVTFADGVTARQVHETVLISQKLATADELKTLSDEAVAGQYALAKKMQQANVGEAVGKALIGDSNKTEQGLDFNKVYNA